MVKNENGAVLWHDEIADDFNYGYSRSPAFMERAALWQELIDKRITAGQHVLDAGCGSGIFSFMAAARGAQVVGIDGSPKMIDICQRQQAVHQMSNIDFKIAMLDALDAYPDASYDVILSSSVLEYVPDFHTVLANFVRLLKPGGSVILSMPNASSLYRCVERVAYTLTGRPRYFAHVCNLTTPAQLQQKLTGLGLTVVETRYFADPPVLAQASKLLPLSRAKSLFVQVATKAL